MTPCCRRAELCTSSVARRLLAREENQNKHAQKFAIIRHQYVMDSLVRTRPMFDYGSQHCIGHKISCLRDIIAKINLNGFVQKKKNISLFSYDHQHCNEHFVNCIYICYKGGENI